MKIIICGSMAFAQEMLEIKQKLEGQNHIVIVPTNVEKYADGTMDVENKWEKIELDVIRAYFEEIKGADAILIINKDKKGIQNYVGGNGLIEMAFAHVLNKKIFLLNPVPQMSYSDEIEAMNPIVLDGNIRKIRDEKLLRELNNFLGVATLNTYAGGGAEVDPEETGFKELEYQEGDWDYKDSYTGFFQSWGREVVWHNQKPFWTQIYGGGMTEKYQSDTEFAHLSFDFLKKALSAGEKQIAFQPRGPKIFTDNYWEYSCEWQGDITKFEGREKILFKGEVVFTHNFLGGLILNH